MRYLVELRFLYTPRPVFRLLRHSAEAEESSESTLRRGESREGI